MARVVPEERAIDRCFDYVVPAAMRPLLTVGARVRVPLGSRKVPGIVVALTFEATERRELRELAELRGVGPSPELVELSAWAAWRWAGPSATFLRAACPPRVLRALPPAPARQRVPEQLERVPPSPAYLEEALAGGPTVVRLPPASDPFPVVRELCARLAPANGSVLVLAPTIHAQARTARLLEGAGFACATLPMDWALAAAGGRVVVGSRAAAWGPSPDLRGVVVIDPQDEAYVETRSPTWDATVVSAERAARAGVPWVSLSCSPPLELLSRARLVVVPRSQERDGWARIEVVDRRLADPREGLISRRVVDLARAAELDKPLMCVVNRKGRARSLLCRACGEPARCERCGSGLAEDAGGAVLRCPRCSLERPMVCGACGSGAMSRRQPGISSLREQLEALVGKPVEEVSSGVEVGARPASSVVVATEAGLNRPWRLGAVAFLDFDREVLDGRFRAHERALWLLARASRRVGGREGGPVVVQSRLPGHEVIQAAVAADPGRLAALEGARREMLGLPPHAALASVRGEKALSWVDDVVASGAQAGTTGDGTWLLRANDHEALCAALATAGRPPPGTRVEVDAPRL